MATKNVHRVKPKAKSQGETVPIPKQTFTVILEGNV